MKGKESCPGSKLLLGVALLLASAVLIFQLLPEAFFSTWSQEDSTRYSAPLQSYYHGSNGKPEPKRQLVQLLERYRERHQRALRNPRGHNFLLCESSVVSGFGNRWPFLVTCFGVALLTDRVLLILDNDNWMDFFEPPVQLNFHKVSLSPEWQSFLHDHPLPQEAAVSPYNMDNLNFSNWNASLWLKMRESLHWMLPLLAGNPHHKGFLEEYFHYGHSFFELSSFLFKPSRQLLEASSSWKEAHRLQHTYLIAMQIRVKKAQQVGIETLVPLANFIKVATLIYKSYAAEQRDAAFYICSDDKDLRLEAETQLKKLGCRVETLDERLVYDPKGQEGLTRNNRKGAFIGMLEMHLMSQADQLIITYGSSYGWTAGAWGGIRPWYVTPTGFFGSPVSDPCMDFGVYFEQELGEAHILHSQCTYDLSKESLINLRREGQR